ncbi:MAG: hypothetical protein AB1609_16220, partial [Bacillota bacterium]
MLAKRLSYLLVACCLLALLAGLGGHVVAQGGGASLVLKFPAVKDFGGVSAKVLYLRQDLPESTPLRFVSDRVEAASGFFPAGRTVTVFCAGSRLGSAVAGTGPLSMPVSSPPAGAVVAVVESEQELPVLRWVSHGVPGWSPGNPAVAVDAFSVVGDRVAILVENPYQYSFDCALAFFDGMAWNRTAKTFVVYSPSDVELVGDEFWVLWYSSSWYAEVTVHSDDGTVLAQRKTLGFGKLLHRYAGDVLYDDTGDGWSKSRLYRWDQSASRWVDCGPSLGYGLLLGLYAERDGRLYGINPYGSMVKEYVSGTWRDMFPLPAGTLASRLAVCPDGTVWVAATDGTTWYRNPGASEWVNCGKPLGLAPGVLAAMPDGSVWAAVNVGNNTWAIARWNGSVWVDVGRPVQGAGSSVKRLFPGPGGSLYVLAVGSWYYGY